ncbi:hypothetical protein Tco_1383467 [Tanacetum coccineum]
MSNSQLLPSIHVPQQIARSLRKALAITPVIPAQPFELPPSGNTVIDFVNELGYPEPTRLDSKDFWQAVMGRIYSRDPDIFLTQSKSQSQSEGPKEESNSSPHYPMDGNLKFVPKGETVEVFGMAIPDPLITEAIQQSWEKEKVMIARQGTTIKLSLDPAFCRHGHAPVEGSNDQGLQYLKRTPNCQNMAKERHL